MTIRHAEPGPDAANTHTGVAGRLRPIVERDRRIRQGESHHSAASPSRGDPYLGRVGMIVTAGKPLGQGGDREKVRPGTLPLSRAPLRARRGWGPKFDPICHSHTLPHAMGLCIRKPWQDRRIPPCAPVVPHGGLFLQRANCSADDSCAESKAIEESLLSLVKLISPESLPRHEARPSARR